MVKRQRAVEGVGVTPQTEDFYKGRRVLVTGHTGFKGAWLSLWLESLGATVVGVALEPEHPEGLFTAAGLADRIEHIVCDVRDRERLAAAVRVAAPEVVFHLAAISLVRRSYRDPVATFATNVGGAVNLLEALRSARDVGSLVFVTSDKCYRDHGDGRPHRESDELGGRDPYSASKACAELVVASYAASFLDDGPAVATVRAGNVLGGGDWAEDRIVPDIVRAVRAGTELRLRSPGAVRPWQHVLDPLGAYLELGARLFESGHAFGGAWNIGPERGSERTVQELASAFADHWGAGSPQVVVEAADPTLRETAVLRLSSERARVELGWRPVWDFDAAIAATATWYRRWLAGEDAAYLVAEQIDSYTTADALPGVRR